MAGKHRAPSKTGPRLIKLGSVALAATALPIVGAGTANAATPNQILEAIAFCESGNKNVPNSTGASTASGYLQIINGTWKAYGGSTPRALHASRGEQFQVGQRILAGQGLAAWSESRGCWQSKIGKIPVQATIKSEDSNPKGVVTVITPPPKTEEANKVPLPTPDGVSASKVVKKGKEKLTPPSTKVTANRVAKSYVIKRGDTLSKIARHNGTSWRALYNINRDTVRNPNLIYTGNTLRLR
jgi:LysM repeat protein